MPVDIRLRANREKNWQARPSKLRAQNHSGIKHLKINKSCRLLMIVISRQVQTAISYEDITKKSKPGSNSTEYNAPHTLMSSPN